MSHGAAWLCRFCTGPDGSAWRNRSSNGACYKCKVGKGRACLRKAGGASGCPTVSARQQGKPASPGSGAAGGTGGHASQRGKSVQQFDAENRRLRDEVAALKAAQGGADNNGKPAEPKVEDAELDTLRDHIKRLSGIPECAEQLALKQALYDEKLAAKRAAKPVDTRIRDLEHKVSDTQKALEKKKARVADLRAQQEKVAKELEEAIAEEHKVAAKLGEFEAERVEAYSRRAREAAQAANVELPVPLQQVPGTIEGLWSRLQPDHFQQVGCPADKAKEVTAMVSQLLALALQLPAPAAVPRPEGGAAAQAQQAATAPAASGQTGMAPPAHSGAAAAAAKDTEQDDDEEMDDEELASCVPNADQLELGALKARLREQGVWIRCSRPRKNKLGITKK